MTEMFLSEGVKRALAETDAPPDTDPDEDLTEDDSGAVEEAPEKESDA